MSNSNISNSTTSISITTDHLTIPHFRLYGGQLVVLETRAEWACIEHWVEKAYQPAYQRYAISMKKSNIGDYRWLYADGSNAFPDYCNAVLPRCDNLTEFFLNSSRMGCRPSH